MRTASHQNEVLPEAVGFTSFQQARGKYLWGAIGTLSHPFPSILFPSSANREMVTSSAAKQSSEPFHQQFHKEKGWQSSKPNKNHKKDAEPYC
jgi:hypothetical protein